MQRFGSCGHSCGPGQPAQHLLLVRVSRGGMLPQLQPLGQPGCRWPFPLMLCLKLQALLLLCLASLAQGSVKNPGLG